MSSKTLLMMTAAAVLGLAAVSCGGGGDHANSANHNANNANRGANANTGANVNAANTNANANAGAGTYNRNYNSREEYAKDETNYREEARRAGSTIGSGLEDGWIHLKVRGALAGVDDLRDSTINVDVDNNVVTLRGSVANAAQKTKAQDAARKVENVKNVVNRLEVRADGAGGGNTNSGAANTNRK